MIYFFMSDHAVSSSFGNTLNWVLLAVEFIMKCDFALRWLVQWTDIDICKQVSVLFFFPLRNDNFRPLLKKKLKNPRKVINWPNVTYCDFCFVRNTLRLHENPFHKT